MKELCDLARMAEKYAAETGVVPDIHLDDFIFRFLIENRSFDSLDSAVRYYFVDGRESARKLSGLLDDFGIQQRAHDFSMLEFASGYGCVSRHLTSQFERQAVVACDIHEEGVRFLRSRIGIKAILSCSNPADFKIDRSFDVVFALSFFSHMPRQTWAQWVAALYEIVRPGGVLLFTTHGQKSARFFGDPEIADDGFWFMADSEQKDLDRSEYGQTIVTEEFVRREILAVTGREPDLFREGIWWGHQDLYAVKRGSDAGTRDVVGDGSSTVGRAAVELSIAAGVSATKER